MTHLLLNLRKLVEQLRSLLLLPLFGVLQLLLRVRKLVLRVLQV